MFFTIAVNDGAMLNDDFLLNPLNFGIENPPSDLSDEAYGDWIYDDIEKDEPVFEYPLNIYGCSLDWLFKKELSICGLDEPFGNEYCFGFDDIDIG